MFEMLTYMIRPVKFWFSTFRLLLKNILNHVNDCFRLKIFSILIFLIIECRAAEELFEADKGGNKWETIECCI